MAKTHAEWAHQHLRWSETSLHDALVHAKKAGDEALAAEIAAIVQSASAVRERLGTRLSQACIRT